MFELKASEFYSATRLIRNLLAELDKASNPEQKIDVASKPYFVSAIQALMPHLEVLRADLTWIETDRMSRNLSNPDLTYSHVRDHLHAIEGRLQDELLLRRLYVLDKNRVKFFDSTPAMFGED